MYLIRGSPIILNDSLTIICGVFSKQGHDPTFKGHFELHFPNAITFRPAYYNSCDEENHVGSRMNNNKKMTTETRPLAFIWINYNVSRPGWAVN